MQEVNWADAIRVTKVHQGIGEEEEEQEGVERNTREGLFPDDKVLNQLGTGTMTTTSDLIGEDMQIQRQRCG
jgi:hypothetical protein